MDKEEKGLLINLIEEASEVSQMAAKWLRFGRESYNPDDPTKTPNHALLARELGNLQCIINKMVIHDLIYAGEIQRGYEDKVIRLKKYPLISNFGA